MSDRRRGYVAYLLRLWQVGDERQIGWRASLENAHTGKRQGFASLTELFTFLENEVCQAVQGQTAPSARGEGGDIDNSKSGRVL
jgi:hypothetical protein